MAILGEKICNLRAERGLTVKALAAEAAVDPTTVVRIEHGGRFYPDTIRKILTALHASAPLSESDAFEVADASKLSRAAVADHLRRTRPLLRETRPALDERQEIDRWRLKCYALVDRMLARAESAQQVEVALVAMVMAFESALPESPEGPMLTRRGPVVDVGGHQRQTTEHYVPRRKNA